MTKQQQIERLFGNKFAELLRRGIPQGMTPDKILSQLDAGSFGDAEEPLIEFLRAHIRRPNLYEANPHDVARRLLGTSITYVDGLGSNNAGLITKTGAFSTPTGNCPELFSAEPGTVGLFKDNRRGGYNGLLIAAHLSGQTGVISIEGVTVGKDRLTMSAVADLFHVAEQVGKSVYAGNSPLVVTPRLEDRLIEGYNTTTEQQGPKTVYALRRD